MRNVNFANVAQVVAAQLNVVAVVRNTERQGSDTRSRLSFGPSAGKRLGKPHASQHPATPTSIPAAPGSIDTTRTERSYRMFAACQQGRLWRSLQLSKLLPATFALAIAG